MNQLSDLAPELAEDHVVADVFGLALTRRHYGRSRRCSAPHPFIGPADRATPAPMIQRLLDWLFGPRGTCSTCGKACEGRTCGDCLAFLNEL